MVYPFKRIVIVCGHYGSGKTNVAINIALELQKSGKPVTIVDLDLVNPYFRTFDVKEEMAKRGIRMIAPHFAGTNLDIPSLPPDIFSVFEDKERYVVIDVGGDDAGATALGSFAHLIKREAYDFLYVVNQRRYLTRTAEEAAALLGEIERASRLSASAIINNTNLAGQTDEDVIISSFAYMNQIADKTKLPLAFISVKREVVSERLKDRADVFPIDIFVGVKF